MTFLVLSPSLTTTGGRNRLAQSALTAFDRALTPAERRWRASHAAVYNMTPSPARHTDWKTAVAELQQSHQVDVAILDTPYRWQAPRALTPADASAALARFLGLGHGHGFHRDHH